jgi:hypothetical protein
MIFLLAFDWILLHDDISQKPKAKALKVFFFWLTSQNLKVKLKPTKHTPLPPPSALNYRQDIYYFVYLNVTYFFGVYAHP